MITPQTLSSTTSQMTSNLQDLKNQFSSQISRQTTTTTPTFSSTPTTQQSQMSALKGPIRVGGVSAPVNYSTTTPVSTIPKQTSTSIARVTKKPETLSIPRESSLDIQKLSSQMNLNSKYDPNDKSLVNMNKLRTTIQKHGE